MPRDPHQIRARALLLGLEPRLAAELAATLADTGCSAVFGTCQEGPDLLSRSDFDLVFCGSDPVCFLTAVRGVRPGVPVIVASRIPEVSAWLSAMEQGAADYCAAPFEPALIRWVLETNLPGRSTFAAA